MSCRRLPRGVPIYSTAPVGELAMFSLRCVRSVCFLLCVVLVSVQNRLRPRSRARPFKWHDVDRCQPAQTLHLQKRDLV